MTIEKPGCPGSIFAAYDHSTQEQGSACVLWVGRTNSAGYGSTRLNGRVRVAHLAAWIRENGEVPDGLEIDHLCNERRCINTAHMELVTHAENCRRRHERAGYMPRNCVPRSRNADECSRGHALTPDNIYITAATGRGRCRQCRADRMQEHFTRVRVQQENERAAGVRMETVGALAEATASHLRMLGRWQPGTIAALLAGQTATASEGK